MHTANNMGDGHLKTAKRVNLWYEFLITKTTNKKLFFHGQRKQKAGTSSYIKQ